MTKGKKGRRKTTKADRSLKKQTYPSIRRRQTLCKKYPKPLQISFIPCEDTVLLQLLYPSTRSCVRHTRSKKLTKRGHRYRLSKVTTVVVPSFEVTSLLPPPKKPFGPQMYVKQLEWCNSERANLRHFHGEMLSLRRTNLYFKKDKRRSSSNKNPGPMLLGYTTFAGASNTQAVGGFQCPYLYKAHLLLEKNHPELLENVRSIIKIMWDEGSQLMEPESIEMERSIDRSLCFPGTRFTSAAVQFNMATNAHMDQWNFKLGWQGVLVLGLHDNFEGGEVDFARTIRVRTRHGTAFFGKNGQVVHKVWKVYSGSRMIIACWSSQSVVTFSKEVLARGFTLEYATSLRLQRVAVLQAVVKRLGRKKKDKKRIEAREKETTAWKIDDDKYMEKCQ